MKSFKICDTATGLFSTGGDEPRWSKTGKVWRTIGHVKLHLQHLCWRFEYPSTAEVIEFTFSETASTPVRGMLVFLEQAQEKRENAKAAAREARKRAEEQEQLRVLLAKYGPPGTTR